MKTIGLQEVESFLRRTLPEHLTQDLCDYRMVKEADLECCVYYHLRRFLGHDDDWRFFARKHARRTKHFIDLLIFRKGLPRIAIELKWNHSEISQKDRQSLRRGIKNLRVNKAYFITTSVRARARGYKRVTKNDTEKHRLFEVFVELPLEGDDRERWRVERRKYASRMSRRTRRKPKAA